MALSFLVLQAIVCTATLEVRDTSGAGIGGAWISSSSGVTLAVTDDEGIAGIPDEFAADSLLIGRIGFRTWSGTLDGPPRVVYLRSVPVPSGVVIPVTGSRSSRDAPAPSTVYLESDALERLSTGGLRALQGISAGLSVREYGGAMPVTSVSVRGGDPGQLSWFVDGHRLDSPRDGSPAGIPDPALFGGMDISRGGGSSVPGGGLAGTVSFRPEAAGMPAVVSTGADLRGGVSTSARFPVGADRMGIVLRRNRGAGGSSGLSASGLLTGNPGHLSYGLMGSWSEGDPEDPDWAVPSGGHRTQTAFDGWMSAGIGGFTASAGLGFGRLGYTAESPEPVDDVHRDWRLALGASRRFVAGPLSATAGTSLTGEWVESTALGARRRTALTLSADAVMPAGPVALHAAALGEVSGDRIYPGLRLTAGIPLAGSLLRSHVSAARSFHLPGFNDLYWPPDAFAEGNPSLHPETSLEAEAGVTSSVPGLLDASVTAFFALTDDLIIWLPGAGGIWSPGNVSRARRAGLEFSADAEPGPLSLSGTLTWLDAVDLTDGSVSYGMRLPYRPEYTWGAEAGIRVAGWLSAGLSAFGSGIRFTNASQTAALPEYTVLSGTVSSALPRLSGTRLEVYVTNALDERYEETDGYPGQPRTFGIRIRWTEQ